MRTTALSERGGDALLSQVARSDLIRSVGNDLIGCKNTLFDEPTDLMI